MTVKIEIYDAVRDIIAQRGFTPEMQTKISLFLTAAKNANALFLGAVEFRPFLGLEQQFLHTQYFQEMESLLLLTKVTRWSTDPRLYQQALQHTAPLWNEWRVISGPLGIGHLNPVGFYQALALGHAMLSQVRITPIIPVDADTADPYVIALRRIEQDNARMIQTQIALLRSSAGHIPVDDRESLIEQKQESVRQTFLKFLGWLTADQPATANPQSV